MCCVIIHKPKGVPLDKELLQIRHKSNSDSWGFVVDGKIEMKNNTCFDNFWDKATWIIRAENEALIHFRTATSGQEKDQGDQPIFTNNSYFFLNGNLAGYFGKRLPDTVLYALDYIGKLKPNFLDDDTIKEKIMDDCLVNNAVMAFMDTKGRVFIFNKQRGVEERGLWFSNPRVGEYAGFGYSGVYPYKEGEKRYNI